MRFPTRMSARFSARIPGRIPARAARYQARLTSAAALAVEQLDAATRARRWERFREAFPDVEGLHVADLGGSLDFWLHAPVRPAHVQIVRSDAKPQRVLPWLEVVVGDPVAHQGWYGMALCEDLAGVARDRTATGIATDPAQVAAAVRRLAPRYWARSAGVPAAELTRWFPDAVLRREHRAGRTVSYIAAKPR